MNAFKKEFHLDKRLQESGNMRIARLYSIKPFSTPEIFEEAYVKELRGQIMLHFAELKAKMEIEKETVGLSQRSQQYLANVSSEKCALAKRSIFKSLRLRKKIVDNDVETPVELKEKRKFSSILKFFRRTSMKRRKAEEFSPVVQAEKSHGNYITLKQKKKGCFKIFGVFMRLKKRTRETGYEEGENKEEQQDASLSDDGFPSVVEEFDDSEEVKQCERTEKESVKVTMEKITKEPDDDFELSDDDDEDPGECLDFLRWCNEIPLTIGKADIPFVSVSCTPWWRDDSVVFGLQPKLANELQGYYKDDDVVSFDDEVDEELEKIFACDMNKLQIERLVDGGLNLMSC
ncbi:uncharacterized protein LOC130646145 [Hydractinia symbiolongicarpus]|uniref:uncharacterized protein LOC130646145 n=1 Tax=Hydractinia symbiolongicarpus TaxID=13093 RepID=UPI0025517A6A|nr:uncharacterized protein LOC130646145 [Hydractinia symbiolongicarpus]